MTSKNYLKKLFELRGIRVIKPTHQQLDHMKMTQHRLNQILENKGIHDLTVSEKDNLENWLWDMFGEAVDITKDPTQKETLAQKHQLIKG